MKTKNIFKKFLYGLSLFAVALIAWQPDIHNAAVSLVQNLTHEDIFNGISGVSMALTAPMYYSRTTGQPVNIGAADIATISTAPAVCVCDAKPYAIPEWITLTAVAGAAGDIFKITPFDDVAEAVQGSLGNLFFSIQELAFGAGTIAKQDGTFIFGADVVRNITATRMIAVDYINVDGTEVASTSSYTFNYIRGFIPGNDNKQITATINAKLSNTNVTVLTYDALAANAGKPLMWKANEGFASAPFIGGAGTTLNIRVHTVGWNYYA